MDSILRAAATYAFLLLIFRLAGKRSLAQITTFDFVLLLMISETTQNALTANNYSLTNSFLVIITLVSIDIGLSLLKGLLPNLEKFIDGVPLIIVEDGQPLKDRMKKARVDEADVLTAGRELHGLERMDQIKYAVLERSGGISVIPKSSSRG
jgi:uncharacterized membrane protein YcaP (DUF421 family)